MKRTVKILSLVLCVVLFATALASCTGETMVSYGEKTLSVNVYRFLLSRMKGTLAYYGYEVDKDSFWNTVTDMDGTTYNDYFCDIIKDQAVQYCVADALFDEYGLTLTEEDEKKVDELLANYVKRAGSKSALQEELKEFGVNYDMLREIYIIEAKMEKLQDHIYGENGEKIGSDTKEEYFNENYVAFKQIFLATYDYLIDEDRFGDSVYYTNEKHEAIAYDKVNGATRKDEFGKVIKDVLGDPEYFTEDGRIAYDREKGVLGYVMNNDGDKVIQELSEEKKAELYEKAGEYAAACDSNSELFEEYIAKYDESDGDSIIYLYASAGYYASQNDAVAYFDQMAEKLGELDVGECTVYKSAYGYHVMCKYENESGAYDDKENEDVFESFYPDLIARLFEELCREKAVDAKVDVDVFESAPTMKDVGINTLY